MNAVQSTTRRQSPETMPTTTAPVDRPPALTLWDNSAGMHHSMSLQSLTAFIEGEIGLDAIHTTINRNRANRDTWCSSVYSIETSAPANVAQQITFTHRAKAIADYDADPEYEQEVSFRRNDVFDISQVTNNWWVGRKETGETGVVPSNFFELLLEGGASGTSNDPDAKSPSALKSWSMSALRSRRHSRRGYVDQRKGRSVLRSIRAFLSRLRRVVSGKFGKSVEAYAET